MIVAPKKTEAFFYFELATSTSASEIQHREIDWFLLKDFGNERFSGLAVGVRG
jgi:hypothetical protein